MKYAITCTCTNNNLLNTLVYTSNIKYDPFAANNIQGVKKVPDPKQNYIGLMTEG